jgi:hypothetical protein
MCVTDYTHSIFLIEAMYPFHERIEIRIIKHCHLESIMINLSPLLTVILMASCHNTVASVVILEVAM